MSLKTIQNSFHSQLLMIRSIHRLIHSDNFCIAYSKATKSEKEKVEKDIKQSNKRSLQEFIKKQLLPLSPFHRLNVKELRKIGGNVRISKYWMKDKITLIKEIEDVVKRIKESSK